MKLKFNFIKETNYQEEQIISKIITKLNEKGVGKIETIGNVVSFRNDSWDIGSNIKAVTEVNNGYFEIIRAGDNVKIKYTCYVSIIGDILLIILTILAGIFFHGFFYFICLIILIQFIYRIVKIKSLNNDLIEEISTMS